MDIFEEEKQSNINKWTSDVENILECISYNSGLMAEHHKHQYEILINNLMYYKIPIIFISSLNSVFAIGLNQYIEQNVVSTITCLLSLLCACISSTELYLSIQKRSDAELISYRSFYLLALKVNSVLKLNRENRSGDGDIFMTQCLNEYSSLFENSQVNGLGDLDKLVGLKDTSNLNILINK
jgi:hypothetical protein